MTCHLSHSREAQDIEVSIPMRENKPDVKYVTDDRKTALAPPEGGYSYVAAREAVAAG
jgi:hypothetical protein